MLNLTGISKTYPGGVQALQDIHLEVSRGMFGLLVPNGAGKSSLMRTIATLQQPDCGSITFNDIDILQDKTTLRRTLGYLPQEFGAYPRTSALTMLKYLAALKGIHGRQQQQVVEELLVKTNLWDARSKSVDKFSGGMKQRYGIAQQRVCHPPNRTGALHLWHAADRGLCLYRNHTRFRAHDRRARVRPPISPKKFVLGRFFGALSLALLNTRRMLDSYLNARSSENEAELPVMYTENQATSEPRDPSSSTRCRTSSVRRRSTGPCAIFSTTTHFKPHRAPLPEIWSTHCAPRRARNIRNSLPICSRRSCSSI